MASGGSRALLQRLQKELKTLNSVDYHGILCQPHEDNLQVWDVYMEGPSDTPYEKGIFRLLMEFPNDYPHSPPALRFLSKFWHPNVYPDGRICISILHAPVVDEYNQQEDIGEKWRPVQNAGTVLLSVQSMLSDPNVFSAANVDASTQWRDQRDAFNKRCEQLSIAAFEEIPAAVRAQLFRAEAAPVFQPEHTMYSDLFADPDADIGSFDFQLTAADGDDGDDGWSTGVPSAAMADGGDDGWSCEVAAPSSTVDTVGPSESSSSMGTEPQDIHESSSFGSTSPVRSRKRSAHPV